MEDCIRQTLADNGISLPEYNTIKSAIREWCSEKLDNSEDYQAFRDFMKAIIEAEAQREAQNQLDKEGQGDQ